MYRDALLDPWTSDMVFFVSDTRVAVHDDGAAGVLYVTALYAQPDAPAALLALIRYW